MKWEKFESSKQIDKFLTAFRELNKSILGRINRDGVWFDHFWLSQLNLADCFISEDQNGATAIVTYPKVQDIHYMRWQTPSLSVRPNFELLNLPRPLDKKTSHFNVPLSENSFKSGISITGMKITEAQYCTALNLCEHAPQWTLPPNVEHKMVSTEEDANLAISVIQSRISEFGSEGFFEKYYVPLLCSEIAKIPMSSGAWCAFSKNVETGKPIAVVLYSGWELPLGGPRAALVDDIVVLPNYRGHGIASSLQAFAYSQLKSRGVAWICGNIEQGNFSSLRQSEKIGRKPWSATILVKEEAGKI